ncbi:MAG: hypothetical protein HZB39_00255 [Planctomycetes bacterium]|nr:hypothetical protein [Planctomycetota bacterium]
MVHDRRQRPGLSLTAGPALLVTIGVVLACAVVASRIAAIDVLWTDAYRDDAYYYFDLVRNLALGRGPTVGDGPPTSGVQVLWVGLLVPLFLAGGDAGLEHGARWLGLALLGLAGVALGRTLAREGVPSRFAVLGGLALASDPFLVLEAQNGQESGLCALICVALIALRRAPSAHFWFVCVVATLARAELWLVATALAWVRPERPLHRAVGPMVALVAYAAVNLVLATRVVPDAGWPMAWLAHDKFLATGPGFSEWLAQLWFWGRPLLLGGPFATAGVAGAGALIAIACCARLPRGLLVLLLLVTFVLSLCGVDDLIVPAVALAIALAFALDGPPASPRMSERDARGVVLGLVAVVALHDLWRWSPRDYYWIPIATAGMWAVAHAVAAATRAWRRAILIAGLVLAQALAAREAPRRFAWQSVMQLAAERLRDVTPRDARIGAFNAGLLAFRSGRRIVNLDGVVNAAAFHALREHRLGGYLKEQGIDWLCVDPLEIEDGPALHARGRYFGPGDAPRFELVVEARFVDATLRAVERGAWSGQLVLLRRISRATGGAPHFAELERGPDGRRLVVWRGALGEALVLQVGASPREELVAASGTSLAYVRLPAAPDGSAVTLFAVAADGRGEARVTPLLEYR